MCAIAAAVLLLSASLAAAQESVDIDPSQPTNLYTNIDFNFEVQDHPGDGDLYGINIIPAIAFNDQNRLDAEIPILRTAYEETENTTGLGDIRLRYFYVPYKAEGSQLFNAAGISIDAFLPTGDEESGRGAGSLLLAPGFTFGLTLNEWLSFFPILSYQHSFKAGRREPGGWDPGGVTLPPGEDTGEEVEMRGIRAEGLFVIQLPRDSWLQTIPLYSRNLKNGADAFNVRLQYGIMLNPKNALQFEYQREFRNQRSVRNQFRLAWSYFL